jgi:hypothetical protein
MRRRSEDWTGLFIDQPPARGDEGIHALVSVPLPTGCVMRHGLILPRYLPEQRERVEEVKRNTRLADPQFRDSLDFDPD